jgi:hypothetical protein
MKNIPATLLDAARAREPRPIGPWLTLNGMR